MQRYIRKVAILGSGVMGSGIAGLLTGAGIEVLLLDMVPRALTEKEEKSGLTLNDKAVRNRIALAGRDILLSPRSKVLYDRSLGDHIQVGNFTDDMNQLASCDWIIEVVVENLEIKKQIMSQVCANWNGKAIVSTNTSGVEIHRIIEDLPLPFRQHFLGTHFFNPVRQMKLLEVIPHGDTLPEIVEFIREFGHHTLGKGVVMAKDTPCFVANRVGAVSNGILFQAMKQRDFTVPEIDLIFGDVMARPRSAVFRTSDIVGLDTLANVMNNLQKQLSDAEERALCELPSALEYLIQNKLLGDKAKAGFYKKVGKDRLSLDLTTHEYAVRAPRALPAVEKAALQKSYPDKLRTLIAQNTPDALFAWDVIRDTLIFCAARIPEIADDYKTIDDGMKWGYNWLLGPFEIWDALGVESSVARMRADGKTVPQWVLDRLAAGHKTFYDHATVAVSTKSAAKVVLENDFGRLTTQDGEVLQLQFKTKSNSITDDLVRFLDSALDVMDADYLGMVICNQGKNFSVGANLNLIGEMARDKRWNEIVESSRLLQTTLLKLKYAKGYVVSAPFGKVLGGGAEVVLHSHGVVAHVETCMGLVEAGVGLVPGGGGCKELLLRTLDEKFQYYIVYGQVKQIWERIVMAKVTGSAFESAKLKMLGQGCNYKILLDSNPTHQLAEAVKLVHRMYEDRVMRPVRSEIPVLGTSGRAALQNDLNCMLSGGFLSAYDAHIASKIADILTGGNLPQGTRVSEEYILELEREAFASLCGESKTLDRMEHMLRTGKPLRN
ncbi:MAG: 3-hydroxyacyl-CoA dehydrogenase NAD-binding domain-containing protein [Oscillospiraceae bacterium]